MIYDPSPLLPYSRHAVISGCIYRCSLLASPHSLELSEQLSLASFEDWTWKRFAVFNGEETPVVTLERAPLLNLLLYSLFLSLWDINLINSSVHTFHIRVFNNARSKSILADSSNNSG